jgi:hypothetical protein
MNNQDIKEITEIESLFQNIKINRLYYWFYRLISNPY